MVTVNTIMVVDIGVADVVMVIVVTIGVEIVVVMMLW